MALFLNNIPVDLEAPMSNVADIGVESIRAVDPHLIPMPWYYRIIHPLLMFGVPLDVCFHGVYDGSSWHINRVLWAARSICWYPEWMVRLHLSSLLAQEASEVPSAS